MSHVSTERHRGHERAAQAGKDDVPAVHMG